MRCVVVFLLLFIPIYASAQGSDYPQGYFRNPLDLPMLLAGNFGECRPGHFHSGLDIKTGGKENVPVYAAAEGYVSRIKMEPGGFGHGLYIAHPNGYTTLYAHLNDFAPAIQKYLRQQQYGKESCTLDIALAPEQFPVRKGQLIAWSGNTGGSTAPHLHFEIRDSKTEHPLNPQLFGFDVADRRPPVPTRLAVYGEAPGIYRQSPQLIPLKKRGDTYYTAKDTIEVTTGNTPIGIEVNDYMDGSDNTLAFHTAEWYLADELQGRIELDDIGYHETRYLHAYADYKTRQKTGAWIQMLYRLPGNKLEKIYRDLNAARGAISPGGSSALPLRIVLKDVAGNEATVMSHIRIVDGPDPKPCPPEQLWEPDRIRTYSAAGISFSLDEDVLYDEVCAEVRQIPMARAASARYVVLSPEIPAHHAFSLSIRPSIVLPFDLRNKIAMMYSDGKSTSGRAAQPAEQGWYKADVRAFGDYWLEVDTSAPVVKALTPVKGDLSKARSIAFRATDAGTSVRSFRGELDGRWLLFEQSGATWTYKMDGHCPKGRHTLRVTAVDDNGNTTRQEYAFTR